MFKRIKPKPIEAAYQLFVREEDLRILEHEYYSLQAKADALAAENQHLNVEKVIEE